MATKRTFLKCAAVPLLLLVTVLIWRFPAPEHVFFPAKKNHRLAVRAFNEMRYVANGAAGCLVQLSDTMVQFDYRNQDERPGRFMKPVSGVEFMLDDDTLDARRYRFVDMLIAMENGEGCSATIITAETIDSAATKRYPRYSEASVQTKPDGRYRIAVRDVDSPQWWRSAVGRANFIRFVAHRPDFSRVTGFRIEKNSDGERLGASGTLVIQRIAFASGKNVPLRSAATATVIILGFVLLQLTRDSGSRSPGRLLNVSYTPVDIPDAGEQLTGRITQFIGTHFHEDIKVAVVAKAVGCRHEQVSEMLDRTFGMKFNRYLNHIRITEAKRLLEETGHSIAEIALAVGFNNITNFNRIFRQAEEVAPREYRLNSKPASGH